MLGNRKIMRSWYHIANSIVMIYINHFIDNIYVSGKENIPVGPKIIVANHLNATDVLTAEVSKTVENAFRDVNIAFANEIALICESMGVNVYEIREFINERHDRNMHIQPQRSTSQP